MVDDGWGHEGRMLGAIGESNQIHGKEKCGDSHAVIFFTSVESDLEAVGIKEALAVFSRIGLSKLKKTPRTAHSSWLAKEKA